MATREGLKRARICIEFTSVFYNVGPLVAVLLVPYKNPKMQLSLKSITKERSLL